MAFIVQWGTTGPAVMLAYKTYTPGLGCRSGSYLIYGGCATVVFVLMLISMLLSHQAMLMFETVYRGGSLVKPSKDATAESLIGIPHSSPKDDRLKEKLKKSTKYHIICATAIVLRKLGKVLAVANAMWLIISSLLEFSSGFDNCYCQSTHIGLGEKAFVTLFPDARSLETKSFPVVIMTTFTSAVICIGSVFVFSLSTYY